MRTAYCMALHKIMSQDKRVFALTADIGFGNFDRIKADFPERFINVGVAEANMIGIAAGLTLSGKTVFVFTIAPFVTMRCLEQIRVDLCYQNLNVKIVGAGGGFVYGAQGTTHHAIEEIGILRTLPHMTIICPADPVETEKAIYATMSLKGPVYIRIGRNKERVLHDKNSNFSIGKAITVREGKDITVIAYGPVLGNVIDAARELAPEISVRVVDMHTVKPVDVQTILKCAQETKMVITVEEHNIIGGLGSAVAEVLAENPNQNIKFTRIGLNDVYCRVHASYEELQDEYGLSKNSIARSIRKFLQEIKTQ